MTPQAMAALHAKCFKTLRAWNTEEFKTLLELKTILFETHPNGFALGQMVGFEAELLTICIDPKYQRQGYGTALIAQFETAAQRKGAKQVFLEVAQTNIVAITLYTRLGYCKTGVRKNYYLTGAGENIDAILMAKTL